MADPKQILLIKSRPKTFRFFPAILARRIGGCTLISHPNDRVTCSAGIITAAPKPRPGDDR
jgi:hypothetical protein